MERAQGLHTYRARCASGNSVTVRAEDVYRAVGEVRKLDEEPLTIVDETTGERVYPTPPQACKR